MVVHQLDLFGGPLKPPKKIKVDDDVPDEEPQQYSEKINSGTPEKLEKQIDHYISKTGSVNGIDIDANNEVPEAIESLKDADGNMNPETAADAIYIENPLEALKNDVDSDVEPSTGETETFIPEYANDFQPEAETITTGENDFLAEDPPKNSLVYVQAPNKPTAPIEVEAQIDLADAPEEPLILEEVKDESLNEAQVKEADIPAIAESQLDPEVEVTSSDISGSLETGIADEIEEIEEEDAPGEEEIIAAEEMEPILHPGRKPNFEQEDESDILNIPSDEQLFKRQYYSMRETSAMFRVNQSLLRFWENEFDILQPKKNKKGDRYFRPVDIKNLELIYHLLRVRKFTLEGAKDFLQSHRKAGDSFELIRKLEKLKSFLLELKAGL